MSETNLWALVDKNPYNPHFWTELVQVAESSKNYDGIVRAYSGFLQRFPLMHIYWNKWALVVQQNNPTKSVRDSIEIFDRAVAHDVLESSVEMWQFYCDFVVKYNFDITEDDIRSVFERAVSHIGNDYNSDSIWSLYINWEEEHQKYDNASALFARVLSSPIRNLDSFWKSFVEHSSHHSIEKAASPAEKSEIDFKLNELAENDVTLGADDFSSKMQQLIFDLRYQSYLEAARAAAVTVYFEYKIIRSYFHFQKPGELQIANWYEYLDYMEHNEADVSKVCHTYERCLIPCNLCPDIWMKYAIYLNNFNPAAAEDVLRRGDASPVSRDPEYQRLRGLFAESTSNFVLAHSIFNGLADKPHIPGESAIAVASFMLREGIRENKTDEMKSNAVNLLLKVLDYASPYEYSSISAFLRIMKESIDIDQLLSKCGAIPLALAMVVKAFIESGDLERAKNTFRRQLMSEKCELNINDQITMLNVYAKFLRENDGNIKEIREVEKTIIGKQKEARIELLKERREKCKDTNNLHEVLDRWILYLQETDSLSQ
ncbi:pre-mRNA-processing factor 39-like isoform X1 [Histomonas meleagridis]|uniref:pre-mRNA-processing factor 39-like isoform X1 n=1 Tax=Histomonas meleagridis TaxID=135588 RepID=UPI00355941BB|nr:pre-mRNA-processing factor 39-like isoform X1 [Histomonas meleagridis]KAH0805938.1 pre-mRNA-processing factor 39-like isoform X1 [Histomonas meleagridis]